VRITFDKVAGPKFQQNLAGLSKRMTLATKVAANMAAWMIEELARDDIAAAGNFGASWQEGLHVRVEGAANNMRISMYHDIPFAGIFETGGEIHGNPLLWIPISGTDAAGIPAKDYGGTLFSASQPRKAGPPLLFSISDKAPKYFGVESVVIPKKFHLAEIQRSVMATYNVLFSAAFRGVI